MSNRKSSFKVFSLSLTFVLLAFSVMNAFSQVTVSGSTGANGAYATVGAAFTAINGAGTQAGNNILIEVSANTTEAASATLTAGDWTTLTVRPSVAGVIVEGSIVGAVIRLNGADNVTLDGRVGGVGTTRDMTVRNNSTATATAAVWLSSVTAGNGASGNTVRNLELATGIDTSTSGSSTFGIIMSGTTISTTSNGVDNDNNSFIANRIIKARYGIVTRGTNTDNNLGLVITDNLIGPAAFGTDQIAKGGIFLQFDNGALVSRNTIQFVGCLEPQTCAGTDRFGIGVGSESWLATTTAAVTSANYTVTRNTIHDIIEENTFSAIGIQLATTQSGGATNNLVANNFIYNLRSNGTGGDQVCGIGIAGGNGDSIVNNSISITGDMDPGAAGATSQYGNGIRIPGANAANNANFTVMNNSIYMDASSSSTAAVRYYAITLNSAAYVFGTGGLNFNNYYINPANIQLQTGGLATGSGNTTTTQFATLANWQAALTAPQDAASIQADPNHASPTADLHLLSTSPNINVGATIAAVPVDIDNEARPNGANYDIGADEFYPQPGNLQLSSAAYSGNEGTMVNVTVNRVSGSSGTVGVTATLNDVTATGGALCGGPADYINPGPQVLSFGDTVTSQSFMVQLCTDLVTDPSETFTVTLSAPTGGAGLGTPTVATVTITDIPPPFNGTYTVGGGGNYPSLTNPGGIFEAINLGGASGPVTINITSDLSGETGTHALNEIVGGHAVLIKPSGVPRSITGTSASSIIKLSGSDNVRIDGSTAATFAENVIGGTPGLRELTITNSGAGAAIWIATNATSGANNNVVRNLTIAGPGGFIGQGILAGSGAAFGTAAENGRPNSNNTINNLRVTGVQNALFAFGDATTLDQNWTVSENDLGSTVGAEKLSFRGIAVQNAQNAIITQNVIAGISSATSTSSTMSGILLGGVLNGGTISKNYVRDIRQNNTVGWGSNGIFLNSSSTAAGVVVANNFVSDVASQGFNDFTSTDNGYGIMINNGGGYSIYYNSVLMNAEQVAVSGHSSALNVASAVPAGGLDVRNNIFVSTQTIGNTYGVIDQGTSAAAYAFINNNDYYSPLGTFNIGRLNSINHTTLAGWQGATGQDLASISADPLFTSATDLRPLFGTPVQDKGTAVSVLDDIDDNIRSVVGFSGGIPDMGAKERLGPSAAEASIGGRVVTANGQGIRNAVIVVTGNSLPQPILVRTGSFGYYKVDGLEVGETYVVTVNSKRFIFSSPSRIISLTDSVTDADFIADPQ